MLRKSSLKFCGLFIAAILVLSACQTTGTSVSINTPTGDLLVTAINETIIAGESATPASSTPILASSPSLVDTPTVSTPTVIPTLTETPTPISLLQSYLNIPDVSCIPANTEEELAVVIGVIDGDTIQVIFNGNVHTVTYLGINAPALNSSDKNIAALAQTALQANKTLVYGKIVLLVKDTTDADSSGNLLRYVLTDNQFVNDTLVSQGFAVALAAPPDIACRSILENAQSIAMANHTGVWMPTPTSTPRPNHLPSLTPTFHKSDH